ncbi:hypothetical protein MHY87_09405 [Microvirga sp. ACRRW]|uniref:hypothetical protein n=1 Tax=Microvirga sp. ACRRW TaxID=2918205 RepID=UPI001EF615D3|nr:hypothetical protein [Microvirga sp. ACRRW]MCG7393120.1 hypothetical protein [Microvirga sp. ACRRW]
MTPQSSHHPSYTVGSRSQARSSFCIMPHVHGPDRNTSFIFGRSDSRIRPLLNQAQRDRLHCWSMIVALVSSAAGTTLLLTAILR